MTDPAPPTIRAARPGDAPAIDALLRAAFGGGEEAALVAALRREGAMAGEWVCHVPGAAEGEAPCGYVALSAMRAPRGWLALAPVAVAPAQQRRGMGAALVRHALAAATGPVVVLGAPEYYGPLGFDYARAGRLTSPYPIAYTGLFAPDLAEARPRCTLVYPAAFGGG